MDMRLTRRVLLALLLLVVLAAPRAAHATSVDAGFDLLHTVSATISGTAFTGVPLGSFNFGGTILVQSTGTADTIVQRLARATVPNPPPPPQMATVTTQLVALQLVSTTQVNLGLGTAFYYVTLQSAPPSPPSTGSYTITFSSAAGGTFSSAFDVFFDVHKGAPSGAIATSGSVMVSSTGTWSQTPPPGAVLINGANFKLNGTDTSNDFWPAGVAVSTVPEPATLALLVSGVTAAGFLRRKPLG